jgi:hypothetical protein
MFGEISNKLKSFKSPVKDIPIKCQVQISKESILKKKKHGNLNGEANAIVNET